MADQKKNTRSIGAIGENIAAHYLSERGFTVLEHNYWKKWGEIDLVTKKDGIIHFVEVKTVSYETKKILEDAVTHETWRPEELVHRFKVHQIEKTLRTWLIENKYDGEWQIDIVAVRIVPRETFATVNFIENITAGE